MGHFRQTLSGALALAILLTLMPFAGASAATGDPNGALSIVVSPPSTGIETKPGQTVSTEVRVQNQGTVSEDLTVSLMKFSAEGETGLPKLAAIEPGDDFAKWVSFSANTLTVAPNEWKSVKMTIKPPANAAFGYYYAVVFSRKGAENNLQKQKANLLASVASLVLLDVQAPGAVRKLEIADFSTNHKSAEFLPIKFSAKLRNAGNVHVASQGSITISKGKKTIAVLPVNDHRGFVLPNSNRVFTAEWSDGRPVYKEVHDASGKPVLDKNGDRATKLNWDNFSASKLRYGKYSARLVMIYNDGKGDFATEARLTFWVMPWRIILAIAAAALFILAGMYLMFIRPLVNRLRKKRRSSGSTNF